MPNLAESARRWRNIGYSGAVLWSFLREAMRSNLAPDVHIRRRHVSPDRWIEMRDWGRDLAYWLAFEAPGEVADLLNNMPLLCRTPVAAERLLRRNGYVCADDRWMTEDEYSDWLSEQDDDDDDDRGPIYSYDTYFGRRIGDETKYAVGVEIEMEMSTRGRRDAFAYAISEEFDRSVVHCKSDGSLDVDTGVEVVTGYGHYYRLIPIIREVSRMSLQHGGRSHNRSACGMHISVSRAHMTPLQEARFIVFFNLPENQEMLLHFARRNSASWARVCADKCDDTFISMCTNGVPHGEKYEAVNCNHDTHLEVRIFKGTLRWKTTAARLALVALVAEYCEQNLSAKDLRMKNFLEWIAERDCPMATAIKEYLAYRDVSLVAV